MQVRPPCVRRVHAAPPRLRRRRAQMPLMPHHDHRLAEPLRLVTQISPPRRGRGRGRGRDRGAHADCRLLETFVRAWPERRNQGLVITPRLCVCTVSRSHRHGFEFVVLPVAVVRACTLVGTLLFSSVVVQGSSRGFEDLWIVIWTWDHCPVLAFSPPGTTLPSLWLSSRAHVFC